MRTLLSACWLIPAGIGMLLVALTAGVVLRVATADEGRASRRATMSGALARDAKRARGAGFRVTAASARLAPDSGEKNTRRGELLRRIDSLAATTYLAAMLPQVDSAIRRWSDDRIRRPLRVALASGAGVPGYRPEYATAVAWSLARWNGAQLPVQFEFRGLDTARADIVVGWATSLDSGRTGKADVTWDQRQYIRRAAVTLATHAPDGRLLTAPEMTALALHELGHALGLAHSGETKDALYPMTRAADLTARDRATARLLYDLPPGSLRNN
jgi:hypothetical protein